LDTKTTVSALSDIFGVQLNRENIQRRMELLAVNASNAVDPQQRHKMLKDALGVGQAQKAFSILCSSTACNW